MTDRHHFTSKSGFTMVEALVAITILLVGVLGPLVIASRGITDGYFARNQIAANFLAQGAFERLIYERELNRSAESDGLSSFPLLCQSADSSTCDINLRIGGFITSTCDSNGCAWVYDDSNSAYITPSTDSSGTVFYRRITIDRFSGYQHNFSSGEVDYRGGAKIAVTVSWRNFNFSPLRSLTLIGYLYD